MSDAPHPLPTPRFDDTARAALWMIGLICSFSAMAVAGREVSFAFDTFEIMMYRSVFGLLIVIVVATLMGTASQITLRSPGTHVIRNVAHFAGQNLWFYAITVIPLAQVFALEFTAPLWALLLAPLVLGERLTSRRALAALVGFIGILIVTRPSPDTLSWGLGAAATAGIGFAVTAIFTRKLTRTESLTCILFWMTVIQAAFGVICAGIDGDIALPDLVSLPWLVVIALGGLFAAREAILTAVAAIDADMKRMARASKVCARLMTVPGVGPITALAFAAAIDEPSRFKRSRDVGAYLGLVPRRYQSGEIDYIGSISKRGDVRVRTLLYEAANVMLTRCAGPLKLKTWAQEIGARATMRKARVALARRLAIIMHAMMRDGTEFQIA